MGKLKFYFNQTNHMISFDFTAWVLVVILSPFYGQEIWGSEKLSLIISELTYMQTEIFQPQIPFYFTVLLSWKVYNQHRPFMSFINIIHFTMSPHFKVLSIFLMLISNMTFPLKCTISNYNSSSPTELISSPTISRNVKTSVVDCLCYFLYVCSVPTR